MTVTMGETLAARIFAGPAFQSFNLDILLKLGGSLLKDIELAERIANVLASVRKEKRIAVFPGGGPTDKVIEAIAEQANIASEVINPACMRALDQTGIIFAALHPDITATQDLHSFRQILAEGRLPLARFTSFIADSESGRIHTQQRSHFRHTRCLFFFSPRRSPVRRPDRHGRYLREL